MTLLLAGLACVACRPRAAPSLPCPDSRSQPLAAARPRMKFGKQLLLRIQPGLEAGYVDYRECKRLIKACVDKPGPLERGRRG